MFYKTSFACTLQFKISGTVSASTFDLLKRAHKKAEKLKCSSILALVNTPGGSLQSTRKIVQYILQSPIPFLCFIYPNGAQAGSAGAILLQACHLNGAMPTTNLGAATPISLHSPSSKKNGESPSTLEKKIINHTISWLEGLAKMRNRNQEFARDIVKKAKSVEASKAKELGAIDVLSFSIAEFLSFSQGKEVLLQNQKEKIKVQVGELKLFKEDLRYHFLSLISDPQWAYLLFMGSLGLIYFEITHPGTFVPGIIGAMGLIFSLISFHQLEVQWGGLLLLILGLLLLVGEIWISSFGILAIGGLVAITLGSLFLFDSQQGIFLPFGTLILPTVLTLGAVFLSLSYLALKTLKKKKGDLALQSQDSSPSLGEILQIKEEGEGQLSLNGEIWSFISKEDEDLKVKDKVVILGRKGRFLKVSKYSRTKEKNLIKKKEK